MNHSNLVHKRENLYFSLLVAASVLVLILGIVLTIASFGLFLWIIGTIVALSMFTHWIQIGYIRTNGVKVTPRQFTELHELVQRVGAEMGIRLLPDVYILQAGGVLNAFATRFFQKNMVTYILMSWNWHVLDRRKKSSLSSHTNWHIFVATTFKNNGLSYRA